ncbi:hypothetical protein ACRQ5Q_36745 [Bradyrhizobium sp. PMVTL-01]|uniref:hypothetical protein n=1 Tax=Bradyrhizobium sp. PMVTL-01 TaxID=3434999 RepID=UPI003F709916
MKYVGGDADTATVPPQPYRLGVEPPRQGKPTPSRTARPRNYIASTLVIASVSFTLIALLVR